MAQKVTGYVKLQIPAGKATPAPPVGPALGAAQVNIMQFCQQFNAATQDKAGDIIPVEITVYEDRTFDFITKTPPAAQLRQKTACERPACIGFADGHCVRLSGLFVTASRAGRNL